jgi:hypothetical protein
VLVIFSSIEALIKCDVLKTLDGFAQRCTGILAISIACMGIICYSAQRPVSIAELSKVLGLST